MRNDATDSTNRQHTGAVDRRRFLQSAVGAGLALTGAVAAPTKRPIATNALIRVGLIGRDGHREILLDSIPKLANVQWTAYAKGEPLVSTADAFALTRVCLLARDAADTGTWVKL